MIIRVRPSANEHEDLEPDFSSCHKTGKAKHVWNNFIQTLDNRQCINYDSLREERQCGKTCNQGVRHEPSLFKAFSRAQCKEGNLKLNKEALLSCSVQYSSVAQLCLILCNPMNCSTPGLPVHHQLPVFTQTHVLWVGDAIQPSHPLSSPSPLTFNLSQHQGLFKWVSASTSVRPMNIQDWFSLGWTGWISLQSKGLSRVFSNTTVQKHQFFGTQLSL